jgi:multidrug efflux system membrane fusion protein
MKRLLLVLAVLGLIGLGYAGYRSFTAQQTAATPGNAPGVGRGRPGGQDGPQLVLVDSVRRADVPVMIDGIGTVQALNTVSLRSQIDGRLIELGFRDGQDVKAGDVLARIDDATYKAQYDQAVAKKAQDEATLANARRDLERYMNLAKTEYASQQQADTQRAAVAQLEAQVAGDQAAIDNAKAYLGYTVIRAPFDGRTGIRNIDQGNIVRSSDTNGIVTITQLRPVAILFSLPQQQLRAVNAALARGPLTIDALEADSRGVLDRGTVDVVDNQVDPTTGSVRMKASFPNASLQLWPGQFVNIRLQVDLVRNALVVPTAAVQRGPNGAYVYTVTDDSKVRQRPVSVGIQTETQATLRDGVEAGERVVTTGFNRLQDGTAIRVDERPAPTAAATPEGDTGRGPRRPDGQARGENSLRQQGAAQAQPR